MAKPPQRPVRNVALTGLSVGGPEDSRPGGARSSIECPVQPRAGLCCPRRGHPELSRTSVRLIDVAEHAGVSLATASRVLNGSKRHSARPEMRERVLAAVEELGYEPNLHARALAGSTSTTIGLVVHDIRDAYFSMVAGAVVEAAEAHDLFVTIVSTYNDPAREAKYVRLLRVQRPRAIIIAGSGFTSPRASGPITKELRQFEEAGGVVVSLGQQSVGHRIVVGNEEGARSLAHSLVDLGHRSFAVAAGPA